ncbi:DeoR/GlpR transcriptional regulator [Pelagibius litoralis]|uniref:DeoR/GlpR transcriptional regulator n=1 Tax=Pelagibius litoralis TaxID=374515 RepID=A0A967EXH1_9PROT|nr:DeoR/GlpR family DNA-binding transcription regulator [Pelagibius litoralis]NIA69221.1 DeoR/GlpR transcriptional regulator [Pelagibius litoralis]
MRPRMRQARIAELVQKHRQVTVDALAARFEASRETIRRDLSTLAESGAVQKFHGGARLPRTEPEGPFQERMAQNAAAKQTIATKAAALFSPGQTLFIDTGSTTLLCAQEIAKMNGLTVVTNSSRIAATIAAQGNGSSVFLVGGRFDGDNRETLGPTAIAQIATFRADHAVITIGALDAQGGIMDFNIDEAQIARAMIDNADSVVVLADSSKFGQRGSFKVCPLERVHTLVTDKLPGAALQKVLAAAKITVR